jgi:hypothetical protein
VPRYPSSADATPDERELIRLSIGMRKPPFDYDEDRDDIIVYINAPHSIERVERAIMQALAQSDVAGAVLRPFPVGKAVEADGGYTFERWFDEPPSPPEPAVPADQIAFAVSLTPTSAFGWRALREELAAQGRQVIGESNSAIEVGARDASDAEALISGRREKSLIRTSALKRLGSIRRWRVREQLLGNYAGDRDPTQPS